MTSSKIISLEHRDDHLQPVLKRVIRMVPDRDKKDSRLLRLLAFRLKNDGEAATSEFLIRHIRDAIKCAYIGSLYDFLTSGDTAYACRQNNGRSKSPGAASGD